MGVRNLTPLTMGAWYLGHMPDDTELRRSTRAPWPSVAQGALAALLGSGAWALFLMASAAADADQLSGACLRLLGFVVVAVVTVRQVERTLS